MQTIDMYRAYLASTHLIKLCEKVGAKVDYVHVSTGGKYIAAAIEDHSVSSEWSWYSENRVAELREDRERMIRELLELEPQSYVDRDGNQITWYLETSFGKLRLKIGEALCERVLVEEQITEVPDPELAAKALEGVPLVKKVTPKYQWRCSDDILGSINNREEVAV